MVKRCLLLACSNAKVHDLGMLPAIDRYDGPLFRVLRHYLREHLAQLPTDKDVPHIYILSGEFGIIAGYRPIPYYDRPMTLQRARELLGLCPCPACQQFGIAGLRATGTRGFCNRATHNLWTLLDEARQIEKQLAAGTYVAWYGQHVDNSIYRPLIEYVLEQQ